MAKAANKITVRDRDLLRSRELSDDVLFVQPLFFELEVVFKTPQALSPIALKSYERKAEEFISDRAIDLVMEIKKLRAEIDKLLKRDKEGDTKAYSEAKSLTKKMLTKVENAVEGRMIDDLKKEIEKWSGFDAKKMESVGQIDFRGSGDGIRIVPGSFAGGDDKDDDSSQDLAKILKKVVGLPRERAYHFAYVRGNPGGLVISNRELTSAQKKAAQEQVSSAGGQPLVGTCYGKLGKWVFEFENVPQGGIAKQLKDTIMQRCRLPVRVLVTDGKTEEEDEDDQEKARDKEKKTATTAKKT